MPSARVVGHGDHDQGDAFLAVSTDGLLDLGRVGVALERELQFGDVGLIDDAIHGFGSDVENMAAGRIEGHVEGNPVSCLDHGAEENVFRRASLVTGDNIVETEDILHGLFQGKETVRPGVGLVPLQESGPLVLAHRSRAGICEEVDVHVRGPKPEHVEMARFQRFLPLAAVRDVHGLDHLDAKRFRHDFSCHRSVPPCTLFFVSSWDPRLY